jgi:CubicO group peptidase (beta-lactamase class C family)
MLEMRAQRAWLAALALLAVCLSTRSAAAQQTKGAAPVAGSTIWPGKAWPTATPESQGMSRSTLDDVAGYAEKSGGGSGCVIRRGYLVKEWGDPEKLADIKSATKGAVGATLLGLAVDRGLVKLDDLAIRHYPSIGAPGTAGNRRDWLAQITIRHLATMTAGFDDGRPPKVVYRPGMSSIYSNDSANMLAELLTLRFGDDLAAVFKREVMDPLGVPPSEWKWRANVYRPKTINGLQSREFASGITITHRALARIGYLYLRDGTWNGRRVLSRDYIRTATRPTDLPSFVPYYAFYWGSNGRGTFRQIPDDACWALGLGDSFVVACPSLDIVAVRLGLGSVKSQLPGGSKTEDWGKRVEGFFRLVVLAARGARTAGDGRAPYPPSPVIKAVHWAPAESIVRKARGSDNWPITWADDDHLYTAYGDGNGFEPGIADKLSLGFARVEGGPADFVGINIRAADGEQRGNGRAGRKASGMLIVDGVLYMWTRNAGKPRLAWSNDHGKTWAWSDWSFETSFGCPTFLNFGKNYSGSRDDYVYVYSHDTEDAYVPADRMVLAHVRKDRMLHRGAYEFFVGRRESKALVPVWTSDIAQRGAVFTHVGKCYRSGISYNAGLKRYLWCQVSPGEDPRFRGGFGIYDAPEPWGPWTTAYFTEAWDVGPGETSSFPTKWMSADGKTLHLVFSGDDCFSVRKAVLETWDRSAAR